MCRSDLKKGRGQHCAQKCVSTVFEAQIGSATPKDSPESATYFPRYRNHPRRTPPKQRTPSVNRHGRLDSTTRAKNELHERPNSSVNSSRNILEVSAACFPTCRRARELRFCVFRSHRRARFSRKCRGHRSSKSLPQAYSKRDPPHVTRRIRLHSWYNICRVSCYETQKSTL